jgi:DNA helicase-2/ATP-dependent DNA helicase PcrA
MILREEGQKRKTELATLADAIEAISGTTLVAEGLDNAITVMRPIWASIWDEDWASRERDLEAVLLIAEEHPTMESFLTTITLDGSMDRDRSGAREKAEEDPVTISTIHSAKGLEWKHVHLPGFVQGGMPSLFAQTDDDRDEELRIAYVAVSRAEKTLTLYRPRFNGQGNLTNPSEYEVVFKPYVDQEARARRPQDSTGGRVETSARIDLRARMLGKG